MSTTLYIDANRQLSSKKADDGNHNEWTYRLATPIQLPVGSEIALQDTFINRKGITGQTIEIDDDITERIYYTYYLSDNPHYVPSARYSKSQVPSDLTFRSLEKTFCPLGTLFQQNLDLADDTTNNFMRDRGQVIKYGESVPNQRLGMFRLQRDENADKGKTNFSYEGLSLLMDAESNGYTEKPMFACFCSSTVAATDEVAQAYDARIDSADRYLCPAIGFSDIFVPKGVYSVNEIADLIEGQINGKYTDIAKGDRYNDNITTRENEGTYDGSFDTTVYRKAKPFNLYGDAFNRTDVNQANQPPPAAGYHLVCAVGEISHNPYQGSPIISTEKSTIVYVPNPLGVAAGGSVTNTAFLPPFNPDAQPAQADGVPATYCFNSFPNENLMMFMPTHKFNQLCDYWKYSTEYGNFKRNLTNYQNTQGAVAWYNSLQYFDRVMRYGIQHYIGSGLTASATATPDQVTGGLYYKKRYVAQDDLDNTNHQRIFNINGIPNFNDNSNASFNYMPIGLHFKRRVNNYPSFQKAATNTYQFGGVGQSSNFDTPQQFLTLASVQGYNYDVMNDGYYLGSPDLTLTYDGDKSAFAVGNLHQNVRIPNLDMYGNSFDGSGQACVFARRSATKLEYNLGFQGANTPEKFRAKPQIKSSLDTPQSRVGGIAVYNWAYNTALKYGDIGVDDEFDDTDGHTYRKFRESTNAGTHSTLQGRRLNTFSEFFSSETKARAAWNKSLWAKLGFTFENLQDETKWEVNKYYDMPSNPTDTDADATWTAQGHIASDFISYGRTTNADLNAGAAPTISTTTAYKSYIPVGQKAPDGLEIQRTYDNHEISRPYNSIGKNVAVQGVCDSLIIPDAPVQFQNDVHAAYVNSFYKNSSMIPIITSGKELVATNLPQLSKDGYYIVSSDIVDNFSDTVKQGMPLPLLGIVPISNLSNQDFLTNKNTLVHTVSQPKVINQVKIMILKPDLTAPQLEENSSVLLQITMPLPVTNPQQPDITEDEEAQKQHKHPAKKTDPRA